MQKTLTTVTALASSLEDAHETAGRLTQAGFARNSIGISRQGDTRFEVSVRVREGNRARATRAIRNHGGSLAALAPSPVSLLLIAGGLAALGAGIWAVRRQMS